MTAWKTPPPHDIEPPLTRAEIEQAIRHMRATMNRAPAAFQDRYHERLNTLLDQWVTATLEESLDH